MAGEAARAVVCLPDVAERVHVGDLPPNVDVVVVPPEPAPVPDLSVADLIVPGARSQAPLLELLAAGAPGSRSSRRRAPASTG